MSLFTKILVLITYLSMVTVNVLANILPIGGVTTGEISDSYPDLFAPIGFTFSIWGVIYLFLGAYTLYQIGLFQNKKSKKREEIFQNIAPYFIGSSIANALWIFAWHNDLIFLSLLLMIIILLCLIKITHILREQEFPSLKEKLLILVPFSIYFGWITVATIANVTTFLVSIRWYGFGIVEETWAAIILVIGAIIGVTKMLRDDNFLYGLVFIWAYIGILIKHISPTEFDSEYTIVIATAPITIVMLIVAKAYIFLRNKTI